MTRRQKTAADYLEAHSIGVSVILAELAESAGIAGRAWALAVERSRRNPERAMRHMATAETQLHHMARAEVMDSLRVIRAAMNKLDRDLPADNEGDDADPTDRAAAPGLTSPRGAPPRAPTRQPRPA
jgi:hypothetical protein